jgi:hypothetical protein
VVREIPIPTPHADERLVRTTLKPCEEVNNGRVITLKRTVFEAGRDDCRVSKAARDTRGDDGRGWVRASHSLMTVYPQATASYEQAQNWQMIYIIEITS